jgi:tetratricopeptide (TPR) repeat protein
VEIAGIYRSCGLLEQAARFYGKALSIDPRNYTALYNLASVYEERGDFGKARALFLEARRNAYGYSDDVSGVDFHLGRIAFAQGEHKRARKHLRSALRENPVHRGANAMLEGLQ